MNDKRSQFNVINDTVNNKRDHNIVSDSFARKPDGLLFKSESIKRDSVAGNVATVPAVDTRVNFCVCSVALMLFMSMIQGRFPRERQDCRRYFCEALSEHHSLLISSMEQNTKVNSS